MKACKASGNTVMITWDKYDAADSYLILRRKMGESRFYTDCGDKRAYLHRCQDSRGYSLLLQCTGCFRQMGQCCEEQLRQEYLSKKHRQQRRSRHRGQTVKAQKHLL